MTFLQHLFPKAEIRRIAREVGFLERLREVDAVDFVFVVVLSVWIRQGQRIAAMRRALALRSGVELVRSAFWRRFNEPFEALVERLLDLLVKRARRQRPGLTGLSMGFRDVIAVDGSVVVLPDALASVWKGTRRNSAKAALEVHTWVRAVTGELLSYRLAAEAGSETGEFEAELSRWAPSGKLEGVLFLMDRGYASTRLWRQLAEQKAFFLTRLEANFNPTVLRSNRKHRGRSRKLGDQKLREAIQGLRRRYIDLQCRFTVRRPGKPDRPVVFRVVGVYNANQRGYHLYVTNIPPDMLVDEDIDPLYRLRWEVETFYETGRSGLGLHEITSTKPHIVRTFIKAALLRHSVAMQARCQAEANLPPQRWINPMKWVQVWRNALHILLDQVLGLAHRAKPITWSMLARLATDPHRQRAPTRYWTQVVMPANVAV